jgi:hypothetical protein
MNAASVARFAVRSAQSRVQAFGPVSAPDGITYSGKPYCATVGTISNAAELKLGGWQVTVSTVIRVLRSYTTFTPIDQGLITINHSGQVVRIVEIKTNVPAEWVLGCIDPEQ